MNSGTGSGHAHSVKVPGPKTIRILSLDAGGVRCITSLRILEDILGQVRKQTIVPDRQDPPLDRDDTPIRPCDHFDLIGGSEWGGILALMFGRLGMTIPQCLEWFKESYLSEPLWKVFYPPLGSWYEHARKRQLRAAFTVLLNKYGKGEKTVLLERQRPDLPGSEVNDSPCKTVVFVADGQSGSITRLRSYKSQMDYGVDYEKITVLEAALATVAIPLESAAVEFDNKLFMSASIAGYSNPAKEILHEGTRIWSIEDIKTVVSLGSGDRLSYPPNKSKPLFKIIEVVTFITKAVTDSERVNTELHRDAESLKFHCARFSLPAYVGRVDRQEWSKMDIVRSDASDYLKSDDIKSRIISCASTLVPEQPGSCAFPLRGQDLPTNSPTNSESMSRAPAPVKVNIQSDLNGPSQSSVLFSVTMGESNEARERAADEWVETFSTTMAGLFPDESLKYTSKPKIAILDTGIDPSHPFIANLWSKKNHSAGEERYFDFLSETESNTMQDEFGHGTHVAGIFLQLVPFADLYVARVFRNDEMDEESTARVANAIMYATDIWKVNIISMSFGFEKFSSDIYKALDHAYKMDVVLFAAASNDGNASMNPLKFPASQKESVICVNAANAFGKPSEFNPLPAIDRDRTTFLGENVKSAWPQSLQKDEAESKEGTWRRGSGTSVATPIAAAVAAAIMQFGELNRSKIKMYKRLKTKGGIKQIFAAMTPDKNRYERHDGFDYVWPWQLLNLAAWQPEDKISGRIHEILTEC